jgi:hypothetical protein
MADQVVRLADQLVARVAAGLDEILVAVGDAALGIGVRDEGHALAQRVFLLGHRLVVARRSSPRFRWRMP